MGRRDKTIQTLLGSVRLRRPLYHCAQCGATRFPVDELLGVKGTSFSPGVRRLMARAGSRTSFAHAEEDLRVYAELTAPRKEIMASSSCAWPNSTWANR